MQVGIRRLLATRKGDDLVRLARGLAVVAAAHPVDCGDIVGHVVVQVAARRRGSRLPRRSQKEAFRSRHRSTRPHRGPWPGFRRPRGLRIRRRNEPGRWRPTGRSGTLVPGMIQLGTIEPILPARSAPDKARRTPGAAIAAERSTCLMTACACGDRSTAICSMPVALMSSVYRPLPVTNLKSSRRRKGCPTYLVAIASVMALRLRGKGLNCAHDVGVAGATADVAGELVTDVAFGRIWVCLSNWRTAMIIPGVQKPHCRAWCS